MSELHETKHLAVPRKREQQGQRPRGRSGLGVFEEEKLVWLIVVSTRLGEGGGDDKDSGLTSQPLVNVSPQEIHRYVTLSLSHTEHFKLFLPCASCLREWHCHPTWHSGNGTATPPGTHRLPLPLPYSPFLSLSLPNSSRICLPLHILMGIYIFNLWAHNGFFVWVIILKHKYNHTTLWFKILLCFWWLSD